MKEIIMILVGLMTIPVLAIIWLFKNDIEKVEVEIVEEDSKRPELDKCWQRYFYGAKIPVEVVDNKIIVRGE